MAHRCVPPIAGVALLYHAAGITPPTFTGTCPVNSRSTVRILDIGGMIWESERSYASVAAALADAEQALAAWLAENGLPVKRQPGA